MRGIKDFNYPAFDRAAKYLRGHGWEIYSPAENEHSEEIVAAVEAGRDRFENLLAVYMQFDLPAICARDAIFMLNGWQQSEGARLELYVAEYLGKDVYVMAENDVYEFTITKQATYLTDAGRKHEHRVDL